MMNWHYCRPLQEVKRRSMTHSNRYDRQIALPEIGISGQQKLANAKVLVVGAGGLGCAVLQNLAAAGVGTIGIVDGDTIDESNLNRQFLYTKHDCGKNKAAVAAKAISVQNSEVTATFYDCHFTAENAFEITASQHIIVDCTDNLTVRYLINDVALVETIPMVYASIHKFEGQVSVFNYEAGPTYRCLFPEKTSLATAQNCEEAGVLGVLSNIIGTFQATEVIKIIVGAGSLLSGKLLLYNGLQHEIRIIDFEKNAMAVQNGLLNGLAILNRTRKQLKSIGAAVFFEAVSAEDNLIVDLREAYEEPKLLLTNIKNIPLDQLENNLKDYKKNQKIILFCQHGNKSLLAGEYLMKIGYTNVFHLEGGVESLEKINIQ